MTYETTANTAIAFGGYRADGNGIIEPVWRVSLPR